MICSDLLFYIIHILGLSGFYKSLISLEMILDSGSVRSLHTVYCAEYASGTFEYLCRLRTRRAFIYLIQKFRNVFLLPLWHSLNGCVNYVMFSNFSHTFWLKETRSRPMQVKLFNCHLLMKFFKNFLNWGIVGLN